MIRKKYYIPDESDFIIGFEYEVLLDGEWKPKRWTKFSSSTELVFYNHGKERKSFCIKDMIDKELVRVGFVDVIKPMEYALDNLSPMEQTMEKNGFPISFRDENYQRFIEKKI